MTKKQVDHQEKIETEVDYSSRKNISGGKGLMFTHIPIGMSNRLPFSDRIEDSKAKLMLER